MRRLLLDLIIISKFQILTKNDACTALSSHIYVSYNIWFLMLTAITGPAK